MPVILFKPGTLGHVERPQRALHWSVGFGAEVQGEVIFFHIVGPGGLGEVTLKASVERVRLQHNFLLKKDTVTGP
jgi:hypothetical protein